ncbi:MAG TPA: hypothetical protein VF662_09240 [Allosphingosinicella sp.]|jgi:hypothetical protein
MIAHLAGTIGVFLLFALPCLMTWAPIFAFAYWRRNFGGSRRGYLKGWVITSLGMAAALALLGLVEQLVRA